MCHSASDRVTLACHTAFVQVIIVHYLASGHVILACHTVSGRVGWHWRA